MIKETFGRYDRGQDKAGQVWSSWHTNMIGQLSLVNFQFCQVTLDQPTKSQYCSSSLIVPSQVCFCLRSTANESQELLGVIVIFQDISVDSFHCLFFLFCNYFRNHSENLCQDYSPIVFYFFCAFIFYLICLFYQPGFIGPPSVYLISFILFQFKFLSIDLTFNCVFASGDNSIGSR